MGLTAIYRKPRTSRPNPAHKVYPYLLRDLQIDQPNRVWSADITFIPMRRDGQRLHRASLALPQVRVRLPARFPGRVAGPPDHRCLVEILQRGATSLDPCRRQDTDGGLRPSTGRLIPGRRRINVDNFVGAQWTMLSTQKPGTLAVSRDISGGTTTRTEWTAALQTSWSPP